ncbi:hypothetical protein [Marinicella meishanensis]|uniref:hypothetical protein n=1 Tax=Marinicella meishanensis TaxID=2873263 RepID=UPI001CBB91DB|nr:hypothetical protein [Marinicella sp. NBU2979]
MNKEKAMEVIMEIESVFKNASKGWKNEGALKELKQLFIQLNSLVGSDIYLSEKSSSAVEQLGIIFSQRRHQKYVNGVDSVIHNFNVDLSNLKSWINSQC